jgi:uncharacterized protein (TIGR02217 family)
MVDNVILDERIALGFRANPVWKTTVVQAANGREIRNAAWSDPIMQYDFSYNNLPIEDARALAAFFHGRRGRQRAFLLKAYDDYELESEAIGTGNGVLTQFQAIKTYDAVNPWVRTIRHIKNGTLTVTVNGVPATVASYSSTGMITLATPPAGSAIVRATCEYYVPVRFNVDEFNVVVDGPQGRYGLVTGLSCVEVRA